MLRVRGLVKRYGDRVAVDGVDLDVRTGETFGLLGPNGAGKTTTIHCLIGVLAPDAGEIDVAGRGSPRDPEARRALGIAPQELALYGELTGEENLRFHARLHGLRGAALRARIEHALELAGLADRRADRADRYSGGMKRRLNLACALVHDPQVLLLDEPTAGVDPQSRNHLFESIEGLAADGRTILFTTHYMEEAERLCDRVAIIDRGRVLAVDTVEALVDAHGGAATIEVEPSETPPRELGLPAADEHGRIRIETHDAIADLRRLTAAGLPFRSLHVHRPDLESVFLELTGRRLRD